MVNELLDHVEERTKLIVPNKTGNTRIATVTNLSKTIDSLPPQFKQEAERDIAEVDRILNWETPLMLVNTNRIFWTLRKNLSPSDVISYSELQAYTNLYQINLKPYEVDVIKEMDYKYINTYNEGIKHD